MQKHPDGEKKQLKTHADVGCMVFMYRQREKKKKHQFNTDVYHTLLGSQLRHFQQKTNERKVSDLFEEQSCDSEVCKDPASWEWAGE